MWEWWFWEPFLFGALPSILMKRVEELGGGRQMFDVAIQVAIGNKVIARESWVWLVTFGEENVHQNMSSFIPLSCVCSSSSMFHDCMQMHRCFLASMFLPSKWLWWCVLQIDGYAEKRSRQMLWWRRESQTQIIGEAKGGEEEDETGWERRCAARSISRAFENRLLSGRCKVVVPRHTQFCRMVTLCFPRLYVFCFTCLTWMDMVECKSEAKCCNLELPRLIRSSYSRTCTVLYKEFFDKYHILRSGKGEIHVWMFSTSSLACECHPIYANGNRTKHICDFLKTCAKLFSTSIQIYAQNRSSKLCTS